MVPPFLVPLILERSLGQKLLGPSCLYSKHVTDWSLSLALSFPLNSVSNLGVPNLLTLRHVVSSTMFTLENLRAGSEKKKNHQLIRFHSHPEMHLMAGDQGLSFSGIEILTGQ